MFSEKITLRAETKSIDVMGGTTRSYVDTEVWANKKSITRAEFYNAQMAGIKVDAVFVVHLEDWSEQEAVTYGATQYEIVRSYQKGDGDIELICRKREV
jgi:SPP1 family predicted phage head-tail adaptor